MLRVMRKVTSLHLLGSVLLALLVFAVERDGRLQFVAVEVE